MVRLISCGGSPRRLRRLAPDALPVARASPNVVTRSICAICKPSQRSRPFEATIQKSCGNYNATHETINLFPRDSFFLSQRETFMIILWTRTTSMLDFGTIYGFTTAKQDVTRGCAERGCWHERCAVSSVYAGNHAGCSIPSN